MTPLTPTLTCCDMFKFLLATLANFSCCLSVGVNNNQNWKQHENPKYEVSDTRKQPNYFKIFICITKLSFFSIRIIRILHFTSLTIWFLVQNLNSSSLICFLDESYCKKKSDFILFYSRNIALRIYNPTISSSIHQSSSRV